MRFYHCFSVSVFHGAETRIRNAASRHPSAGLQSGLCQQVSRSRVDLPHQQPAEPLAGRHQPGLYWRHGGVRQGPLRRAGGGAETAAQGDRASEGYSRLVRRARGVAQLPDTHGGPRPGRVRQLLGECRVMHECAV